MTDMTDIEALPTAAITALQQGRKIEAITIVRQSSGLQLKDAKDRVERYLATQPALQRQLADAQAQNRRGCLLFVVGLGLVAATAFYFGGPAKN
jgi:hypothetical protein